MVVAEVGVSWGYVVGSGGRICELHGRIGGRIEVLSDKMDKYPMLDTRSVRKLGGELVG
jgi:hypothetical protein